MALVVVAVRVDFCFAFVTVHQLGKASKCLGWIAGLRYAKVRLWQGRSNKAKAEH
jgi:hypothetical protein